MNKKIKNAILEIENYGYIVQVNKNKITIKEPFKSLITGEIIEKERSSYTSAEDLKEKKDLTGLKKLFNDFIEFNCKKKIYGISNGKKYRVLEINYNNMTALCESDAWIGWQRCLFEEFVSEN